MSYEIDPSIELNVQSSPLTVNKLHILYLLQSKEAPYAIDLYEQYKKQLERHDFEILQQMALLLLEKGARSQDTEEQLSSLYGSSIGGIATAIDILEAAISSPHIETQMAAIQYLGNLQEDRCDELLTKAMSSSFFMTRMQAAYQLCIRKSKNAVGQIESLLYKVPPPMRFFFPQFFALIGTHDAIVLLRHMMDDPFPLTRVEAILNAARFGRDDLLPLIRTKATHLNVAEQEACAAALGILKDLKSLPLLSKLSQSPSENVALAATRSLVSMGQEKKKIEIALKAKEGNLFAISLLAEIPNQNEVLINLLKENDLHIRFNAAFSLLQLKDPRCIDPLTEFLLRDSRDLGFQPLYSLGHSLLAWKVISSLRQHQQKEEFYDLMTLSFHLREQLLRECIELPEENFLYLAEVLFSSGQTDLIPLLVRLLENLQTEKAIALLKAQAEKAGAPLSRAYCQLALLRLKQGDLYKQAILNWIHTKKKTEMIRFRPMLSQLTSGKTHFLEKTHSFELTPEEHSRLLIEAYQTIAMEHDEESIDMLLDGLKNGHPKNRPVLAGLLIQAIQ